MAFITGLPVSAPMAAMHLEFRAVGLNEVGIDSSADGRQLCVIGIDRRATISPAAPDLQACACSSDIARALRED
jgi:hypothetical protein